MCGCYLTLARISERGTHTHIKYIDTLQGRLCSSLEDTHASGYYVPSSLYVGKTELISWSYSRSVSIPELLDGQMRSQA